MEHLIIAPVLIPAFAGMLLLLEVRNRQWLRRATGAVSVTLLLVDARATFRGTHSRAGDSSAVRSMEAPRGGVASGRASIAIEASRAAAAAAGAANGAARRRPPGAATFNAVGIANGAGAGAGQVGTAGAVTAGAGVGSVANAAARGAAASNGAPGARAWAAGAGGTQGSGGASPGCTQIVCAPGPRSGAPVLRHSAL